MKEIKKERTNEITKARKTTTTAQRQNELNKITNGGKNERHNIGNAFKKEGTAW